MIGLGVRPGGDIGRSSGVILEHARKAVAACPARASVAWRGLFGPVSPVALRPIAVQATIVWPSAAGERERDGLPRRASDRDDLGRHERLGMAGLQPMQGSQGNREREIEPHGLVTNAGVRPDGTTLWSPA